MLFHSTSLIYTQSSLELLFLFILLILNHGAKAYEVQATICWYGAI